MSYSIEKEFLKSTIFFGFFVISIIFISEVTNSGFGIAALIDASIALILVFAYSLLLRGFVQISAVTVNAGTLVILSLEIIEGGYIKIGDAAVFMVIALVNSVIFKGTGRLIFHGLTVVLLLFLCTYLHLDNNLEISESVPLAVNIVSIYTFISYISWKLKSRYDQALLDLDAHRTNLKVKVHERTQELESYKNKLEALVKERTLELEKALDQLKNTQNQLIQSEKMAALGVLLGRLAHEINNPLNFIKGGHGLIAREIKEDNLTATDLHSHLKLIDEGLGRIESLVNGLLNVSGAEESQFKLCDLHNIIDNSLLLAQGVESKNISVTKKFHSESIKVYGNEKELHQVFLNIFVNSFQSIDDNGLIEISTNLNHEIVTIIINDSGEGISTEHINNVFDSLYTTKESGQGVGLGLTVVYKIIIEHSGEIHFSSIKSQGFKRTG